MLVLRQNLTISTRSGRDLTGSIEISSDLEEILVGLTKISSDLEEILLNRLRSPQIFNYDAENHMDLGKVRSLSTVEMRLERRSKQRKLGSLGGPSLLVSQNFKSKPKLILSVSIIDDPQSNEPLLESGGFQIRWLWIRQVGVGLDGQWTSLLQHIKIQNKHEFELV